MIDPAWIRKHCGVYERCRGFFPSMLKQGSGVIIHISSIQRTLPLFEATLAHAAAMETHLVHRAGDHRALNLFILGILKRDGARVNCSTRKPLVSFGRFFFNFTSECAKDFESPTKCKSEAFGREVMLGVYRADHRRPRCQ